MTAEERMSEIPETPPWIKKMRAKSKIYKTAAAIKELDEAFASKTEREVAYMIATSHEYKKPNIKAALSFVKNYDWEKSTEDISNLQGLNKPTDEEKVLDMARKITPSTVKPLIVVNKLNGIRPQSFGKKILIDGHHRYLALKNMGAKKVPVYKGLYTGDAEKSTKELMSEK